MKVMENNDSLMSRPLLLANIDDLINSKVKYDYGFQIYEALINVWATREAQRQNCMARYSRTWSKKYQKSQRLLPMSCMKI